MMLNLPENTLVLASEAAAVFITRPWLALHFVGREPPALAALLITW